MTVKGSSHRNEQVLKLERPYYEQEQLNTELNYSQPESHGKNLKLFLLQWIGFNCEFVHLLIRDYVLEQHTTKTMFS